MANQALGLRVGYMAIGPSDVTDHLAQLLEGRAPGGYWRLEWAGTDLERWARAYRPHLLYLHVEDPGGGPGVSGDRLAGLRQESPFLRIVQWLVRPDLYLGDPIRPNLASRISACDLVIVPDGAIRSRLADLGQVIAIPPGYVPGKASADPVRSGPGSILLVGDNVWLAGQEEVGPEVRSLVVRARWSDPGRERAILVEELYRRWPDRLLLLGQGWPYPAEAVPLELARPFYARAGLAIVHSLYRDRPDHVPGELYWSLDAGRPTLVRYVPGLERWFQHGVHCLFWQTVEECMSQCQRLLSDQAVGLELGRTGQAWVRAEHSWARRLDQVFQLLGISERGFEFIGLDRPDRERVRMVRARPS